MTRTLSGGRLRVSVVRALTLAFLVSACAGKPPMSVAPASQTASAAPQPAGPKPRLVVVLVIDQFRADYFDWYGGKLTGGLARLRKEGAFFTNAAYPYLNTVTCAGHATIGTGAFPYRHGMILNAWYDRATGTTPTCNTDTRATELSYGTLSPLEGDSAAKLLTPTFGELLRAQLGGRVVAMSMKPRSSIALAGHQADIVTWFDDRGAWTTSSVYGKHPAIQTFVDANPIENLFNATWDRLRPADTYDGADDGTGEKTVGGWTTTFPHPLASPTGKIDRTFFVRWTSSPFSDEYLGRMAASIVDDLRLGRSAGTDFLGVSFSALDLVGHAYGPRSHEVQDVLARVDLVIGKLLDALDAAIGKDRYVLALSADHGVAPIPEQTQGSGRILNAQVSAALQQALERIAGPGKHVASAQYTEIYLVPALAELARKNRQFRETVIATLDGLPGITRAFYGEALATDDARRSSDMFRRAAALSYHPGRSGDFVLVPREHWIMSSNATTHGTLYPYDQRVPVILFGSGVKSGNYAQAVSPADIAPTLASLTGVTMATVDGRVLREALSEERLKTETSVHSSQKR